MADKDYSFITLRTANGCSLELVTEFGGLTNRLQLVGPRGPIDVIVGLADRNAMITDRAYRNIPLFPLVNRLDAGRYKHLGKEYQLPINEPERNNALHGFIQKYVPQVQLAEGENTSEAILTYHYDGGLEGYPFPAEVRIHYVLHSSGGLDISYSVLNRHTESIPVGVGWHPYFGLGEPLDTLRMQLPEVRFVTIDERMLPLGTTEAYTHFHKPTLIGDTQLDHCFVIQRSPESSNPQASDAAIATTVLWSDKQQIGLKIWQQTGARALNYIQVCTAPDRQSIAIEPVSCSINAFNTGDGLVVLEPEGFFTAHMGVHLLTQLET
jgi:aldose 1-epimerase